LRGLEEVWVAVLDEVSAELRAYEVTHALLIEDSVEVRLLLAQLVADFEDICESSEAEELHLGLLFKFLRGTA